MRTYGTCLRALHNRPMGKDYQRVVPVTAQSPSLVTQSHREREREKKQGAEERKATSSMRVWGKDKRRIST